MKLLIIITCFFLMTTKSAEMGSYEVNKIEFTPLHDAIIFNDIFDIINELENNMYPELNKHILSDSDSNEDIEDLLSEYQYYLDKAHVQSINYMQKTLGKNKVPLIHREKFTKTKPSYTNKYDDISKEFIMKYPKTSLIGSFKEHVPHYKRGGINKKPEIPDMIVQPYYYKESPNILIEKNNEKSLLTLLPRIFPKSLSESISSPSCYCKVDQIPCRCGCKQCFMLIDSMSSRNSNRYDNNQNIYIDSFPKTSTYRKRNNVMDDNINIQIKINLQLPKIFELGMLKKNQDERNERRNQDENVEISSKDIMSTINLPFPYVNFPIPVELLGYKTMYNKHDSSPIHKTSMHKKKKSRLSNTNKKYAGKKVIYFHNIKINSQMEQNNTDKKNTGNSTNSNSNNKNIEEPKKQNDKSKNVEMTTIYVSNNTNAFPLKKLNSSTETTYLTVNISKNNDNDTNESFKIENSIETNYVDNKTSAEPSRLKREVLLQNVKPVTQIYTTVSIAALTLNQTIKNYTKETKKVDKTFVGDMELLYWPIETKNVTLSRSKNITALILEKETKKTKLNLTHDIIRFNRSMVLEQAIFGDVDWNDVDTVAPVFMSFVGKYMRGILTFCSQNVCHSMKCADKICHHRICTPDKRLNHKGHCTGNNDTDSVAAMESIMDLPSNVVFEIVDILQNKMLGKIYGKATMCIISKCSTFAASKKMFQRSKCVYKDISSTGHCPFVKNVKFVT